MGVPHDSGEGYLFEYHYNLQHMYFLRETNALVASQEQEILEYLNKGKYFQVRARQIKLIFWEAQTYVHTEYPWTVSSFYSMKFCTYM